MSEWTDHYINRIIFDRGLSGSSSSGNFQKGAGKFKWRTSDMRVISMHTMTDDHLRKAHAHAKRMGWTGKAEQLATVIEKRGGVVPTVTTKGR